MPEKNTTNLPILDDIIKPGNSDKAVHQPSSKVQSSMRSDDETSQPSSTGIYAETRSHTAIDEPAGIPELFTEDQPDKDAIVQMESSLPTDTNEEFPIDDEPIQQDAPAGAGQAQQSPIDLPDIDTLTEEILGSMMLEMEQLLREKIQQTLKKHLSAETGSD